MRGRLKAGDSPPVFHHLRDAGEGVPTSKLGLTPRAGRGAAWARWPLSSLQCGAGGGGFSPHPRLPLPRPEPQEDGALPPTTGRVRELEVPGGPPSPRGEPQPIPAWDRLPVSTGQFGCKRTVKLGGGEGCRSIASGLEPGRVLSAVIIGGRGGLITSCWKRAKGNRS